MSDEEERSMEHEADEEQEESSAEGKFLLSNSEVY